jgi:hypothetical protein
MKIMIKSLVLLGATLALIPAFTTRGQTTPLPRHRELTIRVAGQPGSYIGSGYASTYLTNIRARTIAREEPDLRAAINELDQLGMLPVQGFGLLPSAVAWQAKKPTHKVVEQQADTGLSYAELLMANSLAVESGNSFTQIIAMRAKTPTWGALARQLGVDTDLIIAKANAASQRIREVNLRYHRRQRRDGGTEFSGLNPNTHFNAVHH